MNTGVPYGGFLWNRRVRLPNASPIGSCAVPAPAGQAGCASLGYRDARGRYSRGGSWRCTDCGIAIRGNPTSCSCGARRVALASATPAQETTSRSTTPSFPTAPMATGTSPTSGSLSRQGNCSRGWELFAPPPAPKPMWDKSLLAVEVFMVKYGWKPQGPANTAPPPAKTGDMASIPCIPPDRWLSETLRKAARDSRLGLTRVRSARAASMQPRRSAIGPVALPVCSRLHVFRPRVCIVINGGG